MKTLFLKSQEFFMPRLVWKNSANKTVESAIQGIDKAIDDLKLDTKKSLSEHMKGIEDQNLETAKKEALLIIQEYRDSAKTNEKEKDIRLSLLEASNQDEAYAEILADELGFAKGFMQDENIESRYKRKLDQEDFISGKKIDEKIKDQSEKIEKISPQQTDEERIKSQEKIKQELENQQTTTEEENTDEVVDDSNQSEEKIENSEKTGEVLAASLLITPQDRAEFEKRVPVLNERINALILIARKKYEEEPDEAKKSFIEKNAKNLESTNETLGNLSLVINEPEKTREYFFKIVKDIEKAEKLADKTEDLLGENPEAFSEKELEEILKMKSLLYRKQKRTMSSVKFLFHRLPGIRDVLSKEGATTESIQQKYKEIFAKEINKWAKSERKEFSKEKDHEFSDFPPFLEAFFTNIPNGESLKSQLFEEIKNPEGGIEIANYFEELSFGEEIDSFLESKKEDISALLLDEDYAPIDDTTKEGAEMLYEAIVEAKAAGASQEMREEYVYFLKKNAYINFHEWLEEKVEEGKYGKWDKIGMFANRMLEKFKGFLAILKIDVGFLNPYTEYEKGLEDISKGRIPLTTGQEALRGEYSKRTISENLKNFATLNEPEKKDLWANIQSGTDLMNPNGTKVLESDQKKYIEEYWTQYDPALKTSLENTNRSFGDAVDFLNLKNPEKIISPQDFEIFADTSEKTPFKDFLEFGASKADGEYKLSHGEWIEFESSVSEGVQVTQDGDKLVFSLEGVDKTVELYDWDHDSIEECIKKLSTLKKTGTIEKKEKEYFKDGVTVESVKDFVTDNPGQVGATGIGATIGTFIAPGVGTLIGAGVGYGVGWIADKFEIKKYIFDKPSLEEEPSPSNDSDQIPEEEQ